MIETCFQVLPDRGQVRALRSALRAPRNASSLLIGRGHRVPSRGASYRRTRPFASTDYFRICMMKAARARADGVK